MTPLSSPDKPRSIPAHTARLTRWGGWLGFLLLAGHLVFCHGCHGSHDEDNELSAGNPKLEIRNPKETQSEK